MTQHSSTTISNLSLAWEFLRRNPDYINEWKYLKKEQDNIKWIHSKNAKRWGLLSYCDPQIEDVREVIWNCIDIGRYLRFVSLGENHFKSKWDIYVDLSKFDGTKKIIHLENDNSIVSLSNNGEMIQLYSDNKNQLLSEQGMLLISANLPELYISEIIRIVNQVINTSGSIPFKEANRKYLEYLIILDMRNSKKSHKQIATEIYGSTEVDRHWFQDSWLRSKIRYKIQKAEQYMKEQYKKLLTPS
ncbi:DNA -binding domain-containing protein [Vibrio spartinae]|uniref:DUF2285 domain-containing protein n=1 Tax=Vibrio spartinae TaxID=1918945 RepID=A0ABX6QZ84_9VIBR|nr:DUF2285 domain-containing protein [Vibrio spartinae]QMV14337.1 hypothetical protein Vspart_01592 [Vibrio spartinae]